MASVLYGQRVTDVCTGLWAFRTESLRRLPLRSRGFGLEAELFAWSARCDLRFARVKTDYLPRHGESQPKLHSTRDGWRIARRLIHSRVARRSTAPHSTAWTPANRFADGESPVPQVAEAVAPSGGRP
jgi:hypothetical protein